MYTDYTNYGPVRTVPAAEELDLGSLVKITEMSPGRALCSPSMEWISIDQRRSLIEKMPLGSWGEKCEIRVIFQGARKESITSVVKEVVDAVFVRDGHSLISRSDVVQIVEEICSVVNEEDEVCVLGSCVTTPRTNVMKEVRLLSKEMGSAVMSHLDSYYILFRQALGGIFFGFEVIRKPAVERLASSEASTLTRMSFTALGAITLLGPQPTLQGAYESWKNVLSTDPHAGYPISYDCIPLRQVLKDNGFEQIGT